MGLRSSFIVGADRTANSNAAVNSLAATIGPARLYSVTAFSANAGNQFIQIFDATAVPVNGSIPKIILPVSASQTVSVDFQDGRIFVLGIIICNSTTGPTLTIGASDCNIDCTFRLPM